MSCQAANGMSGHTTVNHRNRRPENISELLTTELEDRGTSPLGMRSQKIRKKKGALLSGRRPGTAEGWSGLTQSKVQPYHMMWVDAKEHDDDDGLWRATLRRLWVEEE